MLPQIDLLLTPIPLAPLHINCSRLSSILAQIAPLCPSIASIAPDFALVLSLPSLPPLSVSFPLLDGTPLEVAAFVKADANLYSLNDVVQYYSQQALVGLYNVLRQLDGLWVIEKAERTRRVVMSGFCTMEISVGDTGYAGVGGCYEVPDCKFMGDEARVKGLEEALERNMGSWYVYLYCRWRISRVEVLRWHFHFLILTSFLLELLVGGVLLLICILNMF